MQFPHLNEHKAGHSFDDTVNPVCPCGTEVETNKHFLLRCHCFSSQRPKLFNNLYNIDPSFSKFNNKKKVAYLLNGSTSNPNTWNKVVINLVIKFLKSAGCFDKPLIFDQWKFFYFLFWFSCYSKVFFFFFFDGNYFELEYYYSYLVTFTYHYPK